MGANQELSLLTGDTSFYVAEKIAAATLDDFDDVIVDVLTEYARIYHAVSAFLYLIADEDSFEIVAHYEWHQTGRMAITQRVGDNLLRYKPSLQIFKTHGFIMQEIDDTLRSYVRQGSKIGYLDDISKVISSSLHIDGKLIGFFGFNIGRDAPENSDDAFINSLLFTRSALQGLIRRKYLLQASNGDINTTLKSLVDSLSSGAMVIGGDKTILLANKKIFGLLGYSSDELVGKPITSVFPLIFRQDVSHSYRRIETANHVKGQYYNLTIKTKDGKEKHTILHWEPIYYDEANFYGLICSITDITECVERDLLLSHFHEPLPQENIASESLIRNLEIYTRLLLNLQSSEAIPQAFDVLTQHFQAWLSNYSGMVVLGNEAHQIECSEYVWNGFNSEDFWTAMQVKMGKCCIDGITQDDFARLSSDTRFVCPIEGQDTIIGAIVVESNKPITDLLKRNLKLIASQFGWIALDIRLKENLRHKSSYDPLSGLLNRWDMLDEVQAMEYERNNTNICAIMVDIDNFKQFNDRYGHLAGDKVIQAVGEIISGNIRKDSDRAYRYGGEEFLVIMPGASKSVAMQRAENLRQKIENLKFFPRENSPVSITISVGMCSYCSHMGEFTIKRMLVLADTALYHAKRTGKNKVVALDYNE